MKKNTSGHDRIIEFAKELGGKCAEAAEELQRRIGAGEILDAPRIWKQCSNWIEAWVYIFRKVKLHPDQYIHIEDNKVLCVVLIGNEFNSKLFDVIHNFYTKLGCNKDTLEIRLIDAGFDSSQKENLKMFFPNAKLTEFTEDEWDANLKLGHANPNE